MIQLLKLLCLLISIAAFGNLNAQSEQKESEHAKDEIITQFWYATAGGEKGEIAYTVIADPIMGVVCKKYNDENSSLEFLTFNQSEQDSTFEFSYLNDFKEVSYSMENKKTIKDDILYKISKKGKKEIVAKIIDADSTKEFVEVWLTDKKGKSTQKVFELENVDFNKNRIDNQELFALWEINNKTKIRTKKYIGNKDSILFSTILAMIQKIENK